MKTAAKRSASSTRWLQRQLNDPYVAAARADGWRSRAAYKLLQLDDRWQILKPGQRVLDLGAAPGGWSQVAVDRVDARSGRGQVVALDLLPMAPLEGCIILQGDFTDTQLNGPLLDAMGGPADVVLSDLAPATTGHAATDHLRILALVEAAWSFASAHLAPQGAFVAKVFQGGTEGQLLAELKRAFAHVRHAKPGASRAESSELYVVASGFRGLGDKEGEQV